MGNGIGLSKMDPLVEKSMLCLKFYLKRLRPLFYCPEVRNLHPCWCCTGTHGKTKDTCASKCLFCYSLIILLYHVKYSHILSSFARLCYVSGVYAANYNALQPLFPPNSCPLCSGISLIGVRRLVGFQCFFLSVPGY